MNTNRVTCRKPGNPIFLKMVNTSKKRGEDIESVVNGIVQYKGHIHLALAEPLDADMDVLKDAGAENEKIKILSGIIDHEIYKNFKLWPTHYAAADLLDDSLKYSGLYTETEKK